MSSKWLLFAGIILLTAGIVMKASGLEAPLPLLVILSGVSCKIFYILGKYRDGSYKPGFESILLLLGLTLFLSGSYLPSRGTFAHPALLMIPGIALKVTFIVIFIIKTKSSNHQ